MSHVLLGAGDPAPTFHQRTFVNPRYAFDTAAGRYIVLCFFGSAADPHARAALAAVRSRPDFFDDRTASFFGVTIDPADETQARIADSCPGFRHILDFDLAVSRLYGAVEREAQPAESLSVRRRWFILDPTLRILHTIAFAPDRSDIAGLLAIIDALPQPSRFMGFEVPAPVLLLHNIFEPDFCRTLIDRYERQGGEESGFMREQGGKTVRMFDPGHKRRKDITIEGGTSEGRALIGAIQARIRRRILPEIAKVHHYEVTRMERYIVACYSAEDRGHFRPHRDNTTRGTAHRRFAVSINLNDDYEGGELSFPEYGPRRFRMPLGGAAIFSCSLLHGVSPVTKGARFAFLPFLYDDAAAAIRRANNDFLDEAVPAYAGASANG